MATITYTSDIEETITEDGLKQEVHAIVDDVFMNFDDDYLSLIILKLQDLEGTRRYGEKDNDEEVAQVRIYNPND